MVMRFEEIKNFGINFTDNPDLKQLGASDAANKKFLVFEEFKKYLEKQGINLTDKEIMEMLNSNGRIEALPADNLSEVFNNILNLGNTVENDAAATAEPLVEAESQTTGVKQDTATKQDLTSIENDRYDSVDLTLAMEGYDTKVEAQNNENDCYEEYMDCSQLEGLDINQKRYFVAQYRARNEFIFENDGRKPKSDWDKLSESEKQVRINKYLTEYSNSKMIDRAILEIDAATKQSMSVTNFRSTYENNKTLKTTAILDVLDEKGNLNILSPDEINYLENQKALRIAVMRQMGKDDGIDNYDERNNPISWETLYEHLQGTNNKRQINYVEAMSEYLNSIPDEQLSEGLRKEKVYLNEKIRRYNTGSIGSKYGQTSKLDNEYENYLSGNSEEFNKYEQLSRPDKAKARLEWIKEQVKAGIINKDNIEEYLNDALEVWNIGEIETLTAIVENYDEFQAICANSTNTSLHAFFEKNMKKLGNHQTQAAKTILKSNENNREIYNESATNIMNSCSEDQKLNINGNINYVYLYDHTGKKTALSVYNSLETQEAAEIFKKQVKGMPEDIRKSVLDNLDKNNNSDVQVTVHSIVKEDENLAIYSAEKGIPKNLNKDVQVKAIKDQYTGLELIKDDKERTEYMKKAADQVGDLATENQLDAHEIFAKSKYSEVAEYAAQNIYTYDKSVQADAYKTSYEYAQESGNSRIIDNLNSNYSRMAPEAQEQIASNPHYAQALSNYTANAIAQDKVLPQLINNESSAGIPKTEKEIFREQWQAMTPTEKYNFICNISLKNFSKLSPAMRKRVLEHAKNDPVFMKNLVKKYGLDLLKNQLFPDALGAIVRELLNDPSEKIKTAREVCQNPSRYPAALVEDCQLIVAEHNDIKEEDFNHLSATDKRAVTNDPTLYEQNYASIGSQSGSNKSNLIKEDDYFKKRANLSFLT